MVASHVAPTEDLARNPGMCPDWESNRQPFGLQPALNPLNYASQGLFLLRFKKWFFLGPGTTHIVMWSLSCFCRFCGLAYRIEPSFLTLFSRESFFCLFVLRFLNSFIFRERKGGRASQPRYGEVADWLSHQPTRQTCTVCCPL